MTLKAVARVRVFEDLMQEALTTSNIAAYTHCLERVAKLAREQAERSIPDPLACEMAVQRCLRLVHKKRRTFTPDQAFDEWAFAILQYGLAAKNADSTEFEPLTQVPVRA